MSQDEKFFEIDGKRLSFLAGSSDACLNWAMVTADGSWAIYDPATDLSGMGVADSMPPDPQSGKISQLIADDDVAGNAGKIKYVGVTPYIACKLWCEGVLTPAHFEHNLIFVDENQIEIGEVAFGNGFYKLVIAFFADSMATYDDDGNVIE